MGTKTYNPADVTLVFGGIIVDGYADGTFITVARNEDAFTLMIGSDGEACRAKSNNKSGTVVFTLMQSSLANDLLSAQFNLDELSPGGDGIAPLLMKDNSGRTVVAAETAWIRKPADITFGREIENREWTIETNSLIMQGGGN
ncbi:MAG: DUF3277 family protein [Nitrospinaceae bacterium]|nr:DUF3277 family protein [Deltaproteobacteria bacterium]NIY14225.1 DUF3277 family protein [Nitrospinaceae bacterium]